MPKNLRKIESNDLLSLGEYSKIRKERLKIIREIKKYRRVSIGPDATFYFESYETMLHQIQEMLYIEKGGDQQITDELMAYNPLIPNGHELIATVMFEIADEARRKEFLSKLGGVEDTFSIIIGDQRIKGVAEKDIERTNSAGKASSVHFLRFPFSGDHISKFLKGEEEIKISITHPNYNYSNILEKESRLALAKDLVAN
ncbi:MAG: DUF3501 family protein [Pseudomonadota bacterium]|nr:DUF3501 family protein [Pseudomonadota bacterium]|tara:strand:+ start:613 stop:1212 length:600 start_codon:yes stop_codon:yes gene_type:complete